MLALIKKMTPASIVLVLVNVVFLISGALLLSFSHKLSATGWSEALKGTDYETAAQVATTLVTALGVTTIILAVIGSVGAVLRHRVLLLIYGIVMVLFMIIFAVIGGVAMTFKSEVNDWEDKDFPATSKEESLAETFNEVYCYGQGMYYCNEAYSRDVMEVFYPNISSTVLELLPNVSGITSLCDEYESEIESLASICTACNATTTYEKYEKILTWAQDQCPSNSTTDVWCAAFLVSGSEGDVYSGSPYGQCRSVFLGIASDWCSNLGIIGILAALCAAVLAGLSFAVRRIRFSPQEDVKPVEIA